MPRRFAALTFTPAVRAAQERYGSRTAMRRMETAEEPEARLGPAEAAFVEARDGFYQATVSESGWPYVQFRGGPPGFLRVLDERTIGYADFRGNRQYLSAGNLTADGRVALILMDHAARRRLKIWARARIVEGDADPGLLDRLSVPGYGGKAERAVVMTIEAMDWNCPQHITPRFTLREVQAMAEPLYRRIAELEAALGYGGAGRPEASGAAGPGAGDAVP